MSLSTMSSVTVVEGLGGLPKVRLELNEITVICTCLLLLLLLQSYCMHINCNLKHTVVID